VLFPTQKSKGRTKNKLMSGRALRLEAMKERRLMARDVSVDVIGHELDIDLPSLGCVLSP